MQRSPLMAKLALSYRLGLPVPPECQILKSEVSVRCPIDLALEKGTSLSSCDAPTVMATMGFWLFGPAWPNVYGTLGFPDNLWLAYSDLVSVLPQSYIAEQERTAKAEAEKPPLGAQLPLL